MFEQYLNKNVSLKLADGFFKYGFVEKIENNFIFLRFKNGNLASISFNDIAGIEQVII